jgi:hypothetical protein
MNELANEHFGLAAPWKDIEGLAGSMKFPALTG